jgi:hypothetical protein
MSFGGRLIGTFFWPGRTFRFIASRPVWVDILVLVLVLISLYSYLTFPFGQKDRILTMEAHEADLTAKWGASGYASELERIKGRNRALCAFVVTPLTSLFGLLFAALIVLGTARVVSSEGNYLQVFSSLLHASLVDKLLGNGLRLYLILSRGPEAETPAGVSALFLKLEGTSATAAFLSQLDPFQLWMYCLFALGLAAAFKIGWKKGLVISVIFWLLKGLLAVALFIVRTRPYL